MNISKQGLVRNLRLTREAYESSPKSPFNNRNLSSLEIDEATLSTAPGETVDEMRELAIKTKSTAEFQSNLWTAATLGTVFATGAVAIAALPLLGLAGAPAVAIGVPAALVGGVLSQPFSNRANEAEKKSWEQDAILSSLNRWSPPE